MKIFVLLLSIVLASVRAQWQNPHTMESNTKTVIPLKPPTTPDINLQETDYISCEANTHLKRTIRLLLKNAHFDQDGFEYNGLLNLKLSAKEYEFLLNFSQNEETRKEVFNEVNLILEHSMLKPALSQYKEMILSFQEEVYYLIFNPTSGALLATVIFLYVLYVLLKAKFTFRLIIKYFFALMYICDLLLTYLALVKEDEIASFVTIQEFGAVPPECDPEKMSWLKYTKTMFQSVFTKNPCLAFYQAINPNYRFLIPPTRILTRQFRTIIVEPIAHIGEASGRFGHALFTNMPLFFNIYLFPLMLVAVVATIFIVLLFITQPNFKFSIFGLFAIEIGQPTATINVIQENRGRRAISEVIGSTRMLVEEITSDDSSPPQPQLQDSDSMEEGTNDCDHKEEEVEALTASVNQ